MSVIAQGGARMDLYPHVRTAAEHVRGVYDLGVTYFDCARGHWDGRAEEAYDVAGSHEFGLRGAFASKRQENRDCRLTIPPLRIF